MKIEKKKKTEGPRCVSSPGQWKEKEKEKEKETEKTKGYQAQGWASIAHLGRRSLEVGGGRCEAEPKKQ